MSLIKIRHYVPSDKPLLLGILKKNIPAYFAESEFADYELYLDREIEEYFVAELDGIPVGGGGINLVEDEFEAFISWDFVSPELQSAGIGTTLLQFRLERLKSLGWLRKIIVRTSQLAYRFYEKNGFELRYTVKDYWAEGFDLYFMEMEKRRDQD